MIGLLNAYHFDTTPGSYQEDYEPMLRDYFSKIMPSSPLKTYLVAQGEFPKTVDECTGWIITGSPASAYDKQGWIKDLIVFTQQIHTQKKKLLGICFGHQLIAKALGGEVITSPKGWGIGARAFNIIQKTSWMGPSSLSSYTLLFSHQDQVSKLPPRALHIASDPFCEFQIFSIEKHIFSFQGHPEFTKEYAKKRYVSRGEKISPKTYHSGLLSLKETTHEGIIGEWIRSFFQSS